MKLLPIVNARHELSEATVSAAGVSLALDKIVKYIETKLGKSLIKIPGIEHFSNSTDHGYGVRYVFTGTTDCLRFNWHNAPKGGKLNTSALTAIDIFKGHHDPSFSLHTKGISFAQVLPALVKILEKPKKSRVVVFPTSAEESINESTFLTEVSKDAFSAEEALSDFVAQLTRGRTFTRGEFIAAYHIVNVGVFDTVLKDFSDKVTVNAKRISLKTGTDIESLKDSILSKAGILEVTTGGSGEVYLKTDQEADIPEEKIPFRDSLKHLEGLVEGTIKGAFNALFVAGAGGTGKTQTVERVLNSHGLKRGNGYYRIAGSASAAGIYPFMYHHRKDIILFDDCDGALADQDARNLIKGATDTQKVRELSWIKKSSFTYDDKDADMSEDQLESLQNDSDKAPKSFEFTGRVIFISNLPLAKLDPDGALRTRAFVINIDPTNKEMFDFMEEILMDVKLEAGLYLSKDERMEVLDIVKKSKRKDGINLRKLVRSLNLAASGANNWRVLVDLYS